MIEQYVQRVVELELQIKVLQEKLQDRDLEIVGLAHELMLEREAQKCNSEEPFLDFSPP